MVDGTRPSLLILSFSPLARDARVLKQIRRFASIYDVTTCGYGPPPDPRCPHLEIDPSAGVDLDGRLITVHAYRRVHRAVPAVRAARGLLRGRAFDLVIANDLEAVPLAFDVAAPQRVLADLHEFSPRMHEENEAWRRRIGPYYRWLARRFAARAGAATTVSQGLATAYAQETGVQCRVVTNAAPYAELAPTPVGDRIRLVHSGACLRNRHLDVMLDAVERATVAVTLDLYLTPNDPGFLAELRDRAAEIDGVRVLDAVPYEQLVSTLNGYDVGVHVLPPVNFNNRWALPNKVFDYVQARVGLLIGPSPEMAALVASHGLGVVVDGFDAAALAAGIDGLNADQVGGFKAAAHGVAAELGADSQIDIWAELLTELGGVETNPKGGS